MSDTAKTWRAKSIEKFNLIPVPDEWKDAVPVGTEEMWKRYYNHRIKIEMDCESFFSNDKFDWRDIKRSKCMRKEYLYRYRDYLKNYMKQWKQGMWDNHIVRLTKASLCDGSIESAAQLWPWTPMFGFIDFDSDEPEIQDITFDAHVWSPYVIPRALLLKHRYHYRWRSYGREFRTSWHYDMMEFDDNDDYNINKDVEDFAAELCSDGYDDVRLQLDVIDAENLNAETIRKLRKFLYGTKSEAHKQDFCSDYDFMCLLFASMGTVDIHDGDRECILGYMWYPERDEDKKFRQQFVRDKIPVNKITGRYDPNGEPCADESDYKYCSVSWLEYYMCEATDSLNPISMHYRDPEREDANGQKDDVPYDADY